MRKLKWSWVPQDLPLPCSLHFTVPSPTEKIYLLRNNSCFADQLCRALKIHFKSYSSDRDRLLSANAVNCLDV